MKFIFSITLSVFCVFSSRAQAKTEINSVLLNQQIQQTSFHLKRAGKLKNESLYFRLGGSIIGSSLIVLNAVHNNAYPSNKNFAGYIAGSVIFLSGEVLHLTWRIRSNNQLKKAGSELGKLRL